MFRGAQWNVTKVIWGRFWDPLLAKDVDGILQRRMDEVIDGEYQNYKAKDGAFVREHFFNSPELKAMVADLSDDEIWKLNRGGHDPYKVYAAYHEAVNHKEQPTVILAALDTTVQGAGFKLSDRQYHSVVDRAQAFAARGALELNHLRQQRPCGLNERVEPHLEARGTLLVGGVDHSIFQLLKARRRREVRNRAVMCCAASSMKP